MSFAESFNTAKEIPSKFTEKRTDGMFEVLDSLVTGPYSSALVRIAKKTGTFYKVQGEN
jgi:hypothetical protein